jgi:hypothetical protein
MPYLPQLNSYLQQSSLLLHAYPDTTRITTKYSLPRKRKTKPSQATPGKAPQQTENSKSSARQRQLPAATLTLKTFEPAAGICLKYRTNKSAEVGRLMTCLGRLAKGERVDEAKGTGSVTEAKDTRTNHERDGDTPMSIASKQANSTEGPRVKKRRGKK